MGDRGGDPEAVPDPAQLRRMAELVIEAIEAGALGFSTSRTMIHRTRAGQVIGTYRAPEVELLAIAEAMGSIGRGVIQLISDAYLIADEEFARAEFANSSIPSCVNATSGTGDAISLIVRTAWSH